ncbi:type III-A CRISPR-associated protein Csm2 [Methanothermococcus sp. SCGC AD-155-C09]|nr:type III-A CRISPR-associated protein Csm2 [Methanothermococcus sp. SCGC AD-155-C09]
MSGKKDKNYQKNKNPKNNQNQKENKAMDDYINKILNLNSENVGVLIEKADSLAKRIGDRKEDNRKKYGISSSKLRDFYDYVVRIKESEIENWYLKLMLLKPKIAYHVNKEKNKDKREALRIFNNEMNKILAKIDKNDPKHFENFLIFFEAVVAYHKGYTKSK